MRGLRNATRRWVVGNEWAEVAWGFCIWLLTITIVSVLLPVGLLWLLVRPVVLAVRSRSQPKHTTVVLYGEHTVQVEEPIWYGRIRVWYDDHERFPQSSSAPRLGGRSTEARVYVFVEHEGDEAAEYVLRLRFGLFGLANIEITRNAQLIYYRD